MSQSFGYRISCTNVKQHSLRCILNLAKLHGLGLSQYVGYGIIELFFYLKFSYRNERVHHKVSMNGQFLVDSIIS